MTETCKQMWEDLRLDLAAMDFSSISLTRWRNSGTVARNPCIVELVRREIPGSVLIPDEPDMIGALGTALYGIRDKVKPS